MDYMDTVRKDSCELVLAAVKEANRVMAQEGDGTKTLTCKQVWELRRVIGVLDRALDLLD